MNLADNKQIANLTKTAKLAVLAFAFAATAGAGYFLDLSEGFDGLDAGAAQEQKLKDEFVDKKRQAVNLDAYKAQLREIEQTFGALLKQLPTKSEMDALLNDINQAGLGRGLEFELFRPSPKENMGDFYAEQPVSIKVNGVFTDFGVFAEDVSKLPRIVNLDDLSITVASPPAKGAANANLSMEATARTYRYLDDKEIAEARKAKKGAEKK